MSRILALPMLPNHPDKGVGGLHQTRKVEAVVTGDRRVPVCCPNRFHGNYRVEARPFRQRRQGRQICHGPDSSAYQASMRVVERVKEILGIAPGQSVLNVLMKVLGDGRVGLCMVILQGEEVVAALVQDLGGDMGLASHRIDGHKTALDGQQVQEFWNRRDLIGLAVSF